MISIDEWKKGLKAWQDVKKQGMVDVEQAELIIPVIEEKIAELEAQEVKNGE